MIIASFQAQYGIRLATELSTMSWREFSYLLGGLSHNTPLGNLIAIRSEKDPKKLKEFTPEQRRLRHVYLAKQAKHKTQMQTESALESIKNAFVGMAK